MPTAKGPIRIEETTTLDELRAQRELLEVTDLRLRMLHSGGVEASVTHASGVYKGEGATDATAIQAAFTALRHYLLPDFFKALVAE